MVLKLELREDQEKRVRQLAKERGVTPEEWALEAIMASTNQAVREEVLRHAATSIEKNAELLRRLA